MNNKNKIGILKLSNFGNIYNIYKAIEYCGAKVGFIENSKDFSKFDKIILPGVGSFYNEIENLKKQNIKDELIYNIDKKITLGICIGMQLFADYSEEFERTEGLSIVKCGVKKIKTDKTLPVIGFNKIYINNKIDLLKDIDENDEFYFMHSYALEFNPNISASTKYHDVEYPSVFSKENIYGVQFHIEKSKQSGIKIIKNFLKL